LLANINNYILSKQFIGNAPTLEELKWKLLYLKASRKLPTSSLVVATKQKIKVWFLVQRIFQDIVLTLVSAIAFSFTAWLIFAGMYSSHF
jgi:hypothetical protein